MLQTKSGEMKFTVNIQVPNMSLEVTEHEEKSKFDVQLSSDSGTHNKITFKSLSAEKKEIAMNICALDVCIHDISSGRQEAFLSAGIKELNMSLLIGPINRFIRRGKGTLCVLPKAIPTISSCTFKVESTLCIPHEGDKLLDIMKSIYLSDIIVKML